MDKHRERLINRIVRNWNGCNVLPEARDKIRKKEKDKNVERTSKDGIKKVDDFDIFFINKKITRVQSRVKSVRLFGKWKG